MNNVYVEYSFDKKISFLRRMFRNWLVALAVLFAGITFLIPTMIVICLMWIVLAYFYQKSTHIEYEYILLDDELQIDKIINKAKRKRLCKIDLQYLDSLTKQKSDMINKYSDIKMKTKDYSSGCQNEEYYLVTKSNNKVECYIIEGNEEIINGIRQRHYSKVL